jgi:hypothetical protein
MTQEEKEELQKEEDKDLADGWVATMALFFILIFMDIYNKMNGIVSYKLQAGMVLGTVFISLVYIARFHLVNQEIKKLIKHYHEDVHYNFYNPEMLTLFSFIICIFLWIFLIDWSFAQYAGLAIGGMVGFKLSKMIYKVIKIIKLRQKK